VSNTFLIVALVALVAVAALRRLQDARPTPLLVVAFVLVLAGVIAVEQPLLGYGLMGAGAAALVVDAVLKRRGKR
jgi:predicted membrane-bound mannosyltransferase